MTLARMDNEQVTLEKSPLDLSDVAVDAIDRLAPLADRKNVKLETGDLPEAQPNPFNPSTKIQFAIPQIEKVSIKVYDIQGKLIKNIVDHELMNPGSYQVKWDGTDLVGAKVASGIYFARMQAGSFMQTKKMMMLK